MEGSASTPGLLDIVRSAEGPELRYEAERGERKSKGGQGCVFAHQRRSRTRRLSDWLGWSG